MTNSNVGGVFCVTDRRHSILGAELITVWIWRDIMHTALENDDLLICCLISFLACRNVCLEESMPCCLMLVVVGSRQHDAGGYDIKAIVGYFVCSILLIKTIHQVLYQFHHGGEIFCRQGNPLPSKLVSSHRWFLLVLFFYFSRDGANFLIWIWNIRVENTNSWRVIWKTFIKWPKGDYNYKGLDIGKDYHSVKTRLIVKT